MHSKIPIVIQAGGIGSRMQPITNVIPKALVPLDDGTVLDGILDQFKHQKFKKIYIITNYLGNLIESYTKLVRKEDITYIEEKKYRGTAGALQLLPTHDTFVISNCDIFIETDYHDIIDYHNTAKADMTIVATRKITTLPYGIFDYTKDNRITEILEKPSYTSVINTGFYVINKSIIDLITEDHMDMNDLIMLALNENKNIYLYHIKSNRYIDIGTLKSYKEYIGGLNVPH